MDEVTKPAGRRGPIRRLYDWTIHWADTPYAVWALFLLAFASSSFFPIPPDVLLIAMALAAPRKSLRYAGLCLVGSVAGGLLGYLIGMSFYESLGRPIIEFYGLTDKFQVLTASFGRHGFFAILAAALTPIPYKVFTISAGFCHESVPIGVLFAASVIGRGLRFFTLGVLFKLWGVHIKDFVERYFNLLTIVFLLLLVLGFIFVKIWSGWIVGPAEGEQEPQTHGKVQTTGQTMLSEDAQDTLLKVARQAVEAAVRGERAPASEVPHPELQEHQGAFVTLRTGDQLRGCIGRFQADMPLWQVVRKMAVAAATQDPRFAGARIQPAEMDDLNVEISVLSPLERIENPEEQMDLGTHGIYVKRGFATGCFLPQVAEETGWSKEEFLAHCCAGKAGLAPDAWKDPGTDLFVFTALVISEQDAAGRTA